MKIIITTDDGEVLDSVDITREEFDNLSSLGALALLDDFSIGDAQ